MRMILQCFFLLLALWLPAVSAWAQAPCSEDFNRITVGCIQSQNLKYSGNPIQVNSELKDNIYFYKTPAGGLGKFKVVGANVKQHECTLILDALTFNGNERSFIPNSSLSISVANNHWLKNRIFLDREGLSAMEMIRTNNRSDAITTNDEVPDTCVLMLTKGADIALYKKIGPKIQQQSRLLLYAPLVLIFIAIFLVVRVFMDEQEKYKTSEALEEAENNKNYAQPLFLKVTKPFYKRYFLPMVQGFKNKQTLKTKYRQKLANAGMLKEMSPEEFMALKIFMILGGPFVFLTARYILSENWTLTITPVMGIVGYFYPNMWLSGLIAKRATEVLRAMPFIVDMLALSVEAGLDFMAAIQRVIEKAPPSPLVEEFETLIKETRIGSSRAEGLRAMGWRVNIIEVNSFCATLIAADSVGASIAPILKVLSSELRVKRSSRAEQQGATAATKILIPMIFFVLPAVLVAIFAPMVLKMMSGNG